jgi:ABC-2 type transport system ATP-binding protein
VLVEVVRDFDAAGIEIDDLAMRRPTLDDVFLTLTGHHAEEDEETVNGPPETKQATDTTAGGETR